MTLLEIVVAMPIVLIAMAMLAQIYGVSVNLREVGRDEWIAGSVAQDLLERMRNEDYRDLYALYNADPMDDPGGPGTAPGNRFAARGLIPLDADPQQMVGEVVFPVLDPRGGAGEWQLREDLVDDELGTPRDLNGDTLIDDQDHTDDYTILPVIVRVRWQGQHGPRDFRLHTIFSELR